tara:strand:+ start:155 stop:259 length:105 start_codon:yes stop_codon:yes gene_type:complete
MSASLIGAGFFYGVGALWLEKEPARFILFKIGLY